MIDTSDLKTADFEITFRELEENYIDELEKMLISELVEKKSLLLPGTKEEVLEFIGKTNFKIHLKRPNKNVWSVSSRNFRESIRKVLRKGKLSPLNEKLTEHADKIEHFDLPIFMLLHVLPNKEYQNRKKLITRGKTKLLHILSILLDFLCGMCL